ncbi:sigma-70 family RNA polymerase sigma factor [Bacillus smithii]|uniref:sigma-70 family RNA polymerase sigma factor n=1 Tax=Bacillus smithii TaxID=1479 RepID=UPI0030C912A8
MNKLTPSQQKLAEKHIKLVHTAISEFYRKYPNSYEETYDACIEALVKAARSFDESKGFKFSTYYFLNAKHEVFRMIRDKNVEKRKGHTISLHTPIFEPKNGASVKLYDLIGAEDRYEFIEKELLKHAWAKLNETEKRCIYLSFFENKTQTEIGKELGISQAHVSRIIRRGLEKMRSHIEVLEGSA